MRLQIVQLETYDDVAAIRDRLRSIRADRVLLVLPRTGANQIIRRLLDLVLIQREAAKSGALIALVTTHPDVITLARALHISVFTSEAHAQSELNWQAPRRRMFTAREDMPPEQLHAAQLIDLASRLRTQSPQQRRNGQIARMLALVVILLTLVAVATAVLPAARVTIRPARNQVSVTLRLTADPDAAGLDVERGIIPAQILNRVIETTASITTTGTVDLPSSLASGRALFTNRTNNPVTIPAGTIVFSTGNDPARFGVADTIIVPPGVGSTATAVIIAVAESGGTRGNIEPNLIINIEGDLGDSLYIRNPESTRGGGVRAQGVVTRADYDSVLAVARSELIRAAETAFGGTLSPDQELVPGSVRLATESEEELAYSAFVGDQAENLTLNIRARVVATIIEKQALRVIALAALSADLASGRVLDLDTAGYQLQQIAAPDRTGQVAILASASAEATTRIDVERARARIAGLTVPEALDRLNRDWLLDALQLPQFELQPALFGRLPLLPVRIEVVIQ